MKATRPSFFIILAIFTLIFFGWISLALWSFLKVPMVREGSHPVSFLFAQGSSVKKVASTLKKENLLRYPLFFILYVRLSGVEHSLKAGEYLVEPGLTPRDLIQKMVKGEAVRHAITIVEGWTFQQIIASLNSNQFIRHTIQGLSNSEIMDKIGRSGELPEGRFAPDTYLFSGDATDTDILLNSYNLMQIRLHKAWENRATDVQYHCPYEALIVSSLIEKETAFKEEKPIIAGVILRRLKKGMLLQVDPTVIYGLGSKYTGKLRKSDMLINTPYNTYLHKGLPPSPIAMPGLDSIEAALHPSHDKYWYYVSKGDGQHKFSNSLVEQGKAVRKYLLRK